MRLATKYWLYSFVALLTFLAAVLLGTYFMQQEHVVSNSCDFRVTGVHNNIRVAETGASSSPSLPSSPSLNSMQFQCLKKWSNLRNITIQSTVDFSDRSDCSRLPNAIRYKEEVYTHFPHFTMVFFNFFSAVASQTFHSNQCGHLIKHLVLNSDSDVFRANAQAHQWLQQFLNEMNQFFGTQVVVSSDCMSTKATTTTGRTKGAKSKSSLLHTVHQEPSTVLLQETWFHHSSDAYMLGSILNYQDPCLLHGAATWMQQQPLRVTVLNRKEDRKLFHLSPLEQFFQTFPSTQSGNALSKDNSINNNNINNNSMFEFSLFHEQTLTRENSPYMISTYFEKRSLRQQVFVMRNTDVLITMHGAAETNIAWLTPCSVVVEVYPYGFFVDFFKDLALVNDIIKVNVLAEKKETMTKKLFEQRKECQPMLKSMWRKAHDQRNIDRSLTDRNYFPELLPASYKNNNNNSSNNSSSNNNETDSSMLVTEELVEKVFLQMCSTKPECRSCSRGSDGVVVTLTPQLEQQIKQALQQRQTCLQQHPFFNDPDAAAAFNAAKATATLSNNNNNKNNDDNNKINISE